MGKAELGFGIMRFQSQEGIINYSDVSEAISEYMKGEFCYFDLHPAYVNGQSQEIIKKYVVGKYPRNRYFVANKMPYYGIHCYADYIKTFDSELTACNVDFFDYYLLHALTADTYKMHEKIGGFKFLMDIKKRGLAKNIGFSFHDKPELLDEILRNHDEVDFVQLQINLYDWENNNIASKECYEIARKYNKKIIVMEPLKGGSLINASKYDNKLSGSDVAEICLKFVGELPGVEVILSGMTKANQVEENRSTLSKIAGNIPQENVTKRIIELYENDNKIQCTKCGYCKRECPRNIAIPETISLLNSCLNLGKDDTTAIGRHKLLYKKYVKEMHNAGMCIKCKKCEKRCPQKLSISQFMETAAEMLEDEKKYYSSERNTQILVYLMKANGVKKVVVSPGATNINFVQSIQCDDYFDVYSSLDERSAAYIACGFAKETGEAVALSCTGATASRNYIPGLTEAFYSNLPILAVTSSQPNGRIGHNIPQMIDRTVLQNDIAELSVELPLVNDSESEWNCTISANRALIVLKEKGKPVHINLVTSFNRDFSTKNLPYVRKISKHRHVDIANYEINGEIGIFCGAHKKWNDKEVKAVEKFCKKYNAILIQDHTGNYPGEYSVSSSLVLTQENISDLNKFGLMIHIGNTSGAYYNLETENVWRVSTDGQICDTFRKLTEVFEMEEADFFAEATQKENLFSNLTAEENQLDKWVKEEGLLNEKIPELPFSNIWIAKNTGHKLPIKSEIHFGILNSLRSWNMFEIPKGVEAYANTGGFGIDGCVSTLVGSSLINHEKLYLGVVGDLAFFYDMNALGNRHIGNNVRIMVINNGGGTEFLNYNHLAKTLGDKTKDYIAACGHFGSKSVNLIKDFAENLGFKYIKASTKEEFMDSVDKFISPKLEDSPLLFEVFTDSTDESDALYIMNTLNGSKKKERTYEVLLPSCVEKNAPYDNIVLWGTGGCFRKNIEKVLRKVPIKYAVDNNCEKWNKEITTGITCISPEYLKKLGNIFVVIMLENADSGFQVTHQLLEQGYHNFDVYGNWIKYAEEFKKFVKEDI